MSKRKIHANSSKAWHEIADSLGKWQKYIFEALRNAYDPQTDRDVKAITRADDMNQVRPRITELIKQGLVIEVGTTTCKHTGKTVRLVTTPWSHNQQYKHLKG